MIPSAVPTIGRLVHYVLATTETGPIVRPALVVQVWGEASNPERLIQLQVFLDGSNDESQYPYSEKNFYGVHPGDGAKGMMWRTSVHYSETHEPGTWHWPARV